MNENVEKPALVDAEFLLYMKKVHGSRMNSGTDERWKTTCPLWVIQVYSAYRVYNGLTITYFKIVGLRRSNH